MEQGSNSWLEWRKAGLGASDAPVVMGVSPWSTPHKLWEQKTGRDKKDGGNWATRRGTDMEPRARAHLELTTGMDFPALLAQHEKFAFMRASLDGWNAEHKIVLEIKCPGAEDMQKARDGKVPEKYYPQIQHQLFVTGAVKCYYYSYTETAEGEREGILIEVLPDLEYIKTLFAAMVAFWLCVTNDTEPPLTERDFKNVRDADLRREFEAWHEAKKMLAHWEATEKKLADALKENPKVKDQRIKCGNFRVNKITRKGNVQYAKIPELAGVDLEPYRAKSSTFQTIVFKEVEAEE